MLGRVADGVRHRLNDTRKSARRRVRRSARSPSEDGERRIRHDGAGVRPPSVHADEKGSHRGELSSGERERLTSGTMVRRGRQGSLPVEATSRNAPWALAGLLGLAFLVKLAVLLSLGSHPLLQPDSGLDTGAYVNLASRVVSGDLLLGREPFFVSPFYVYFLAAILGPTGGSLFAVRLVQILLGTAAAGLVFGTARRLFGDGAAIVAAVLYLLAGVVTFYEILILQTALDPFLTALALFLLAVGLTSRSLSSKGKKEGAGANGGHSWGLWVAAGAAFGLLALNRPNSLLGTAAVAFTLAVPPLTARRRGGLPSSLLLEESPLRTFRSAVTFVLGVALAIAPVTLRNLAVSRELILISSHGGLNFFIGNNAEADGTYHGVPGITPSIEGQAEDTRRVAESEAGRPLSVREVSAQFSRKAWRWIAANPGSAARLFARKVWYVLSGDEVPLNFCFPWYREKCLPLKLLAVGPGLLVPLGGAGLVLLLLGSGRLPARLAAPWVVFAPVYVLAVAAFFAATRYRLPLFVPLAVGAGGAAAFVFGARRDRESRHLAAVGLVAALLAVPALWPTGSGTPPPTRRCTSSSGRSSGGTPGRCGTRRRPPRSIPIRRWSGYVSGRRSRRRERATRRSRRSPVLTGSTRTAPERRWFSRHFSRSGGFRASLPGTRRGLAPISKRRSGSTGRTRRRA